MPSPEEQALLNLLQAERQRNTQRQAAEKPLPDLTPEMLLSGSALREIAAAQSLSAPFKTMAAAVAAIANDGFEFSGSWSSDDAEIDLDPPQSRTASFTPPVPAEHVDLGAIFMARAMAETGASEEDLRVASASGYEDFSFDTDSDIPRAVPNEAVRFQVGRQSPPSRYLNREASTGPSDGSVVSSRGPGGRWQTSPRPRPEGTTRAAARPAQNTSGRAPAAPAEPSRTVYEHLLSDSFDD